MKDNMDYSTNQRDSNPEFSSHHRSQTKETEPQFVVYHNGNDIDNMNSHHLHHNNDEVYNFTNTADHINIPPYNADSGNTNEPLRKEKFDDLESTDSNFLASSLHESHNSRKSLTKL